MSELSPQNSSSKHHAISARLSAILNSAVLTQRSNIRDVMRNISIQSKGARKNYFRRRKRLMDLRIHLQIIYQFPIELTTDLTDENQLWMEIFNLNRLYAGLFAKILEDTLLRLQILDTCNSHLHIMKLDSDMEKLRAAKFDVVQPLSTDELEGVTRKDLGKEEYKLNKLAADRKFVLDSVFQIFLDISMNRSFESIVQPIIYFFDRDAHYDNLVREEAFNRNLRRDLSRQLRSQRNHIISTYYELDCTIENLRSQAEDSNIAAEAQSRFNSKWQHSREEQHHKSIEEKESTSLNNLMQYKEKLDGEHRAHAEVMRLMELSINDLIQRVEISMDKYDKDIEDVDLQIQITKNSYQNQMDDRKDLEQTYVDHEKEMSNWTAFKQERETARLYRQKMNEAASIVQAWWRGMLVRQQLGPYKPRKMSRKPKK